MKIFARGNEVRKLMITVIGLLCATAAMAANFGPAPTFTSDDPAIVVQSVNANTTTGQLNIRVNDVNYGGTVTFVYDYTIGSTSYYHSLPQVLTGVDDNTKTKTVAVNATHWTTKQSSGRGGGYITQHYSVTGGSVNP